MLVKFHWLGVTRLWMYNSPGPLLAWGGGQLVVPTCSHGKSISSWWCSWLFKFYIFKICLIPSFGYCCCSIICLAFRCHFFLEFSQICHILICWEASAYTRCFACSALHHFLPFWPLSTLLLILSAWLIPVSQLRASPGKIWWYLSYFQSWKIDSYPSQISTIRATNTWIFLVWIVVIFVIPCSP